MSYTAPQYVDTKEQAILALASTIKGEAVTGGDGSVNRALDILADVLAEEDVTVPQTDAGAILALADYVSGGGGGGGGETYSVSVYEVIDGVPVPSEIKLYVMEWVPAADCWQPTATEALEVAAGTVIGLGSIAAASYTITGVAGSLEDDAPIYFTPEDGMWNFPMPASDVCAILLNNA